MRQGRFRFDGIALGVSRIESVVHGRGMRISSRRIPLKTALWLFLELEKET
jgi:hypothetical protein